MLKRVAVSVLEGVLVGGLGAAAVCFLHLPFAEGAASYLVVAAVGLTTGLVAGKPFWEKPGALEVLIKAGVGAFIACTASYGFHKWLEPLLPGASGSPEGAPLAPLVLPLIASGIALLFEIDDEVGPHAVVGGAPLASAAPPGGSGRPGDDGDG